MSNTYKRTPTNSDGRGSLYENKVTALVVLRLYTKSDEFYVANNLAEAEKFDDVVCTFKRNGQWSTYLIQLKHKRDKNVKINAKMLQAKRVKNRKADNAYNLSMYFKSYKNVCKKFNESSNDKIFQNSLDRVRFIVFTNAKLDETINKENLKTVDCDILATKMNDEANFIHMNFFMGWTKDLAIKPFEQHFYFCVGKANEREINREIEQELQKILNVKGINLNFKISTLRMEFCEEMYFLYTKKKPKYIDKIVVDNLIRKLFVVSQISSPIKLKLTPRIGQLINEAMKMVKSINLKNIQLEVHDGTILSNACEQEILRKAVRTLLKENKSTSLYPFILTWDKNEAVDNNADAAIISYKEELPLKLLCPKSLVHHQPSFSQAQGIKFMLDFSIEMKNIQLLKRAIKLILENELDSLNHYFDKVQEILNADQLSEWNFHAFLLLLIIFPSSMADNVFRNFSLRKLIVQSENQGWLIAIKHSTLHSLHTNKFMDDFMELAIQVEKKIKDTSIKCIQPEYNTRNVSKYGNTDPVIIISRQISLPKLPGFDFEQKVVNFYIYKSDQTKTDIIITISKPVLSIKG